MQFFALPLCHTTSAEEKSVPSASTASNRLFPPIPAIPLEIVLQIVAFLLSLRWGYFSHKLSSFSKAKLEVKIFHIRHVNICGGAWTGLSIYI